MIGKSIVKMIWRENYGQFIFGNANDVEILGIIQLGNLNKGIKNDYQR
jgi:hypothetical protein